MRKCDSSIIHDGTLYFGSNINDVNVQTNVFHPKYSIERELDLVK